MRVGVVWKRYGHKQIIQNRSKKHELLCQKKMLTQSLTQCLDVKEVEVLSKSDVLKIYRKRL